MAGVQLERPHPEVVAFLQGVEDDGFLDELPKFAGGTKARHAIEAYLDRYGIRCVGEIDITRPRWRERPTTLVPVILDNVRNFEPGAAKRRFEQGRQEAQKKAQEVLEHLRALPDGEHKANETKRMIDRVGTFIGYRECPSTASSAATSSTSRPAGRGRAPRAGQRAPREGGRLLPHVPGAPRRRALEPGG